MPDQYPQIISNNKIEPILKRIRSAAKPERLSQELLSTWGFTASNDRAMPRVLKMLGFLSESGVPTADFDGLRDPTTWSVVLAERIRQTYADLFAMDANIHKAPEVEVRGAMGRITGKDEEAVKRYYNTFKTLCGLADWSDAGRAKLGAQQMPPFEISKSISGDLNVSTNSAAPTTPPIHRKSEYHYNIQIHLPVTTDITVYNAIFKSLRDNLGI